MSVEDYFKAGVKASLDYYMIPQNTNLPGAADSYMAGLKVLNDGTFNSGDKEKSTRSDYHSEVDGHLSKWK